jgi:hypothetical protein
LIAILIVLFYEPFSLTQVSESARFFFDQLPRIASNEYIPTDEGCSFDFVGAHVYPHASDILLSRARTNGIVETTFQNQVSLLNFLS